MVRNLETLVRACRVLIVVVLGMLGSMAVLAVESGNKPPAGTAVYWEVMKSAPTGRVIAVLKDRKTHEPIPILDGRQFATVGIYREPPGDAAFVELRAGFLRANE